MDNNEQQNPTGEQPVTPKKDIKDIVQQGVTALMALYSFFLTLNISFEWFTPDTINAFGVFILAAGAFGLSAWTGWRNTYLTQKGLERAAKVLDETGKKQ